MLVVLLTSGRPHEGSTQLCARDGGGEGSTRSGSHARHLLHRLRMEGPFLHGPAVTTPGVRKPHMHWECISTGMVVCLRPCGCAHGPNRSRSMVARQSANCDVICNRFNATNWTLCNQLASHARWFATENGYCALCFDIEGLGSSQERSALDWSCRGWRHNALQQRQRQPAPPLCCCCSAPPWPRSPRSRCLSSSRRSQTARYLPARSLACYPQVSLFGTCSPGGTGRPG